jgi:ectoine hydroxylase-related dioxygenase (phytanoyl-CoA dioxygenase family)
MKPVFHDQLLETKFLRDGFLVVPDFLSTENIKSLQNVFDGLNTGFEKGFHVTNWSKNYDYRETAHREVSDAMLPLAVKYIKDYKSVLGCYAVKYPGNESEMGIHQDWTITDDSKYISLSIWCPLIDANENTGMMQFYRGSHNIYKGVRGKDIPFEFKAEQQQIIDNHLENVPVMAGDAIFIHHRIVHRSLPNFSSQPRAAAMLAVIPEEAGVKQYYRDDLGQICNIDCADDYWVHYEVEVY